VERYLQAGTLSVVQADPEWCGGVSELAKIGAASLHDVRVIPHGHSLRAAVHTIFNRSPMTFPMGEKENAIRPEVHAPERHQRNNKPREEQSFLHHSASGRPHR
jgi:L-alanine-DL-glutamate epimerase-like enolase superfamily enzyme